MSDSRLSGICVRVCSPGWLKTNPEKTLNSKTKTWPEADLCLFPKLVLLQNDIMNNAIENIVCLHSGPRQWLRAILKSWDPGPKILACVWVYRRRKYSRIGAMRLPAKTQSINHIHTTHSQTQAYINSASAAWLHFDIQSAKTPNRFASASRQETPNKQKRAHVAFRIIFQNARMINDLKPAWFAAVAGWCDAQQRASARRKSANSSYMQTL